MDGSGNTVLIFWQSIKAIATNVQHDRLIYLTAYLYPVLSKIDWKEFFFGALLKNTTAEVIIETGAEINQWLSQSDPSKRSQPTLTPSSGGSKPEPKARKKLGLNTARKTFNGYDNNSLTERSQFPSLAK